MLLIAAIAGPVLIFVMALSYKWEYALIPLAVFYIFWILWFFFATTVPFGWTDQTIWLVIVLVSCGGASVAGWLLRWSGIKDCDPKVQECKF